MPLLNRPGESYTLPEISIHTPDPFLNGVCFDRFSVDFGFASAGGQETVTLTNNCDMPVRIESASWLINSPQVLFLRMVSLRAGTVLLSETRRVGPLFELLPSRRLCVRSRPPWLPSCR